MKVQLFALMEALSHKKNKIDFKFNKTKAKFCLSLHYNADNSYLFVNGKDVCKFKASNKKYSFPCRFCLGIISSNKFIALNLREVSF